MKRRIAILLLLLVGGAIVNVAVAWGCAFWCLEFPNHGGSRRNALSGVDGLHWAVERYDTRCKVHVRSKLWFGFAGRYMHNSTVEELVPSWGRVKRPEVPPPTYRTNPETGREYKIATPRFMEIVDEASGWPMLSLWLGWGTAELKDTLLYRGDMSRIQWGIEIQPPNVAGWNGTGLPLHPIWPGFIINTLFYALLLWPLHWLLFVAPFALRRMIRRRRGLCEKCAYPIGVSPVCTECGAAVPRKVEA